MIYTEPFSPTSKGKIERFFHTVRQIFLTQVDPTKLAGLAELNPLFWRWLEVRYDPEWLLNPNHPVFLFEDGLKIGEAHQVNFNDNTHAKRKKRGRPHC